MPFRLIQGFEQIKPTTSGQAQILASEVKDFLGMSTPKNTADWFLDSSGAASDASGPMIVDTEKRIDGQSLRIQRPDSGATNNPKFNGAYAVDFTKSVPTVKRAVIGFATKYDKTPSQSIPLLQFRYNDTTADAEQASLWVNTDGILFFSSVDMDLSSTSIINALAITGAQSEEGVFRFDKWVYVEVDYNLSGNTPSVKVYVNGVPVLEVEDFAISKLGPNLITSVSVINPQNTYFPGTSYTMYLDDMYYAYNEPVFGPQHIVLLQPTSTTQAEFQINGGSANSYEAVDGLFDKDSLTDYIYNDDNDDEERFGIEDTPASVVSITAVAVGTFAAVDSGALSVGLGVYEGGDLNGSSVTVSDTTPVFAQMFAEVAADDSAWTPTHLDASEISVKVL